MNFVAEALYYKEINNDVFVKAVGHITASLSVDLRDKILERLAQTPVPQSFYIDLSECEYMDSTFMGLLVGFHKRFRQLTSKNLVILRPSAECQKLLQGLGILRLMQVIKDETPPSPQDWVLITKNQSPTTEILLNAHQNLSEISEENEKKFSVLQNILKQKLESGDQD